MHKAVPIAGALVLIALVGVSIIAIIERDFRKSNLELETSEAELGVINAAHMIRECLGTEGIIKESALESLKGKALCEICKKPFGGLCNLDIGARVKDLEGTGEWEFSYSGDKGSSHEIFVNILHDTGKITIGRLYAEL